MTLEVQIATHGEDEMQPVLSGCYPSVTRVFYRVGWQGGIESSKPRDDFEVTVNDANCLTENRNYLMAAAESDIVLFADNDISYTPEQLKAVIDAFESNPDIGFICFRLDGLDKNYPGSEFDMSRPAYGYYPSSCEIAVRTSVLRNTGVKFDTRFGLGSRFIGCEETVFVSRLIDAGIKGLYCPVVIGTHKGNITTGSNPELGNRLNEAKGAALGVTMPWSGVPRLFFRSMRNCSLSELIYGLKGYLSVIFHV